VPSSYASSDDTHAMVARVAPAILELLGDGLPRSRQGIVAALALRHAKDEVVRTLMRLSVTGRLVEAKRKYSLAQLPEPGQG
jgi:predicted thioesterase